MIIDSHSHYLPQEIISNAHFFSQAWGDIEAQVKMMGEAGIGKAILSYPTSDAHLKLGGLKEVARIYNDSISAVLRRYPDKFIGGAVLPVGKSADMLDELARATGELGFKAISLASSYNGVYLDDAMFLPIYKRAAKERVPIFVHSQIVAPIGSERIQDPLLTPVAEYVFDTTMCIGKLLMADILREYADVKFIFAYFGGVIAHLTHRFDSTYQMLRGINFVKDLKNNPTEYLKNIYVDTSGDTVKANFTAALDLVGPGHILWGSDWPAKKDPAASIKFVRGLDISDKNKEDILGGNLENILKGA
ncbi:MAG: amidohydrolase family protein [Candidatus Omnitrophica bacterium]|nr:amidohydrolase family protein [Candidatus Omnitrophota bacterium]MDD5654568.1 amidohydrolase family protein [Candidatus Omnitrophota bacterium]